ncbi:hypothetical protein EYF80_045418 [Liparis tanakae]|uniref:Uncharacterized protein n=1 Tax=Liparis tanakae TaxID=230148 RepID=A0A4Z2FTP8_9TELE|nr:hypothetical protein EYF80_045418 [Liparis tanakae]
MCRRRPPPGAPLQLLTRDYKHRLGNPLVARRCAGSDQRPTPRGPKRENKLHTFFSTGVRSSARGGERGDQQLKLSWRKTPPPPPPLRVTAGRRSADSRPTVGICTG